MSLITYIALREIERTGYAITGSDISAAAADDSFNSVITDLTGLSNNEWILVSGFDSDSNNGWFQASGASSSTKIVQDTTSSLSTESPGDDVSIVGYARGLGESYDLEFSCSELGRADNVVSSVHRSKGGNKWTRFDRTEKYLDFSVEHVTEAQLQQWREFRASVSGGETFTLDAYGSLATPDDPLIVSLESKSFQEQRVGTLRRYNLRFRVYVES